MTVRGQEFDAMVPSPQPGQDLPLLQVVEGIIARTPAVPTEPLWVRVPSFDPVHLFGPCPWTAKILSDSTYGTPEADDGCLVAFNETGEPRVVEWWDKDDA